MNQKPIETTNNKLADAAFHESNNNTLNYASHPHFKGTATFAQYIAVCVVDSHGHTKEVFDQAELRTEIADFYEKLLTKQ